MKELESYSHITPQVIKQIKKKPQLLASFNVPKGCKLWRLEIATGEVTEAIPTVVMIGENAKRLDTTPGKYLFDIALNRSNAEKKFHSQILKLIHT